MIASLSPAGEFPVSSPAGIASTALLPVFRLHPLTFSRLVATRQVLKVGGLLWIAEVRSRFDGKDGVASVDSFVKTLAQLGFKLKGKPDESNKMFFTVSMIKTGEKKAKKVIKWQPLKACTYKRR